MRVGSSKMAIFAYFTHYIFQTFTSNATIIILFLCRPLVALQWHQNRWRWMTLDGLFALKSISGSATNELAFLVSDKTVLKFAELPIYYQRRKCSPGITVCSKVRFIWIFVGVRWTGGRQMNVGSSKMAIFASFARYIFQTFACKATIIILYCVAP